MLTHTSDLTGAESLNVMMLASPQLPVFFDMNKRLMECMDTALSHILALMKAVTARPPVTDFHDAGTSVIT
jgi:hypothetical protein